MSGSLKRERKRGEGGLKGSQQLKREALEQEEMVREVRNGAAAGVDRVFCMQSAVAKVVFQWQVCHTDALLLVCGVRRTPQVPITSEEMIGVMRRYCGCDVGGKDKISYDDAIQHVLQDADRHNMSRRDLERLLEDIDEDKDGQISTLEAAVAQYYLSAQTQQFEAVDPPDRATRGNASTMKVCLDQMFAKLQLRSVRCVHFLRMRLYYCKRTVH